MKNNKTILIASFGAILLLLGACQEAPKKEEPTEPGQEKITIPTEENILKNLAKLLIIYMLLFGYLIDQ